MGGGRDGGADVQPAPGLVPGGGGGGGAEVVWPRAGPVAGSAGAGARQPAGCPGVVSIRRQKAEGRRQSRRAERRDQRRRTVPSAYCLLPTAFCCRGRVAAGRGPVVVLECAGLLDGRTEASDGVASAAGCGGSHSGARQSAHWRGTSDRRAGGRGESEGALGGKPGDLPEGRGQARRRLVT